MTTHTDPHTTAHTDPPSTAVSPAGQPDALEPFRQEQQSGNLRNTRAPAAQRVPRGTDLGAAGDAATLDLLRWLLRFPLLGSRDLAVMLSLSRGWTAVRLAHLEHDGLVEAVSVALPQGGYARLHHLSQRGLRALADVSDGALIWEAARRWGADERGLLRLLPRAPALVAVQSLVSSLLVHAPATLIIEATEATGATDATMVGAHGPALNVGPEYQPVALGSDGSTSRAGAAGGRHIEWAYVRDHSLHFTHRSRTGAMSFTAYLRLRVFPATGAPTDMRQVRAPDAHAKGHEGSGEKWYGLLIHIDGGPSEEHDRRRWLRQLLWSRETFTLQHPGGVFPPVLVLGPDAHRATRWQAAALRLATDAWLVEPLRGGIVILGDGHVATATAMSNPWQASCYALDEPLCRPLHALLQPARSITQLLPLEDETRLRRRPERGVSQACTEASSTGLPGKQSGQQLRPRTVRPASLTGGFERRSALRLAGREGGSGSDSGHTSCPSRDDEELALTFLALDARHLTILMALHQHPLLSSADIASLLTVTVASAERYLRHLLCCGAAYCATSSGGVAAECAESASAHPQPPAPSRARNQNRNAARPTYALTARGLDLARAAAGASVRGTPRLVRPTSGAATMPADMHVDMHAPHTDARLDQRYVQDIRALQRTPEHTAGMYLFFRLLLQSASVARHAGQDHELVWWETGRSCARQQREQDGWHVLRPDGAGEYRVNTWKLRFWLEWDRGTMSVRDLSRKFAAYAHYVRSREWQSDGNAPLPELLIVTSDSTQETRLAEALAQQGNSLRALRIRISLAAPLHARGPLSDIWRPWHGLESSSYLGLGPPERFCL